MYILSEVWLHFKNVGKNVSYKEQIYTKINTEFLEHFECWQYGHLDYKILTPMLRHFQTCFHVCDSICRL